MTMATISTVHAFPWTALAPHPLRALRTYAEDPAHHWDPQRKPEFVPTEDERHVTEIAVGPTTTMRFVYVIIRWQDRLLRKLAVSARRGELPQLPDPSLLLLYLEDHLGFELSQCHVLGDGHEGVVILQRHY
jgi:hypothetical protein